MDASTVNTSPQSWSMIYKRLLLQGTNLLNVYRILNIVLCTRVQTAGRTQMDPLFLPLKGASVVSLPHASF